VTPAERADLADLEREMGALEAASNGWDRWCLFRDSNDNVRPLTPQERLDLDALLKETTA
jgi:hypothetical protein